MGLKKYFVTLSKMRTTRNFKNIHYFKPNKQEFYRTMFSGIVEEMATLVALKNDKENVDLTLTCSFTDELKIDQSGYRRRLLHRDGDEGDTRPL